MWAAGQVALLLIVLSAILEPPPAPSIPQVKTILQILIPILVPTVVFPKLKDLLYRHSILGLVELYLILMWMALLFAQEYYWISLIPLFVTVLISLYLYIDEGGF